MNIVEGVRVEVSYRNGKREGNYEEWYYNGQFKEQSFYRDGKLEGERKVWYSNGQLHIKEFYRGGKEEGKYQTWREDGTWRIHAFYRNGKLEGACKWWRNGRLEEWAFYRNGKLEGEHWYDDGYISYYKFYRNSNPIDYIFTHKKKFILMRLKKLLFRPIYSEKFSMLTAFLIPDLVSLSANY